MRSKKTKTSVSGPANTSAVFSFVSGFVALKSHSFKNIHFLYNKC